MLWSQHRKSTGALMRKLLSLLAVVTLAGLFGVRPASAQLLYSGGEDIDFLCASSGTCPVVTGAAYRSTWAREAVGAIGTAADPPTSRFATPTFTASTTIWVHAQFCQVFAPNDFCGQNITGTPTTANEQMLRVMDSAGNPTLVVRGTGTSGQVAIASRSSSGTFTTLVTCSSAFNATLTQLDLAVTYGTSGSVTLYNSSSQSCTYSGNVTNGDGATTLDAVEFAGVSTNNYGAWSEVIVAGSDTRAMARFTANTSGNGNTTGFTGTNICSSIWNAITSSDTNYGYTATNSTLQECTINSTIPGGNFTVLGLVMAARALVGATGPQHFDFVTRTGGTDYTSSDYAPTNSFSNITNYIQTTNPATSSSWAVTDFQAAGFNVGEESKP